VIAGPRSDLDVLVDVVVDVVLDFDLDFDQAGLTPSRAPARGGGAAA